MPLRIEILLHFTLRSTPMRGFLSYEASRPRPVSRSVENERSAPALRAHTSQREASKHASLCETMRSSRSEILTSFSPHFLMRLTFGLPSNAPRLMSVRSAWLRARGSPLLLSPQPSVLSPASLHGRRIFFLAGYYISLSYEEIR